MGANCSSNAADNMPLVIYLHKLSQPSRTALIFTKVAKIRGSEIKELDITKGEHKTEEYGKVNPNLTIPAMDDDGFLMIESVAMVKYMAGRDKVADHWYPADLKKRARVDEVLDWHHTGIRKAGVGVFIAEILGPMFGAPQPKPEELDEKYKDLDKALNTMENHFLKNQQFLAGNDISIADIFIANEVMQVTYCSRDIFGNHPTIKAWLDRTKERLNPHWDEVYGELNAMVEHMTGGK